MRRYDVFDQATGYTRVSVRWQWLATLIARSGEDTAEAGDGYLPLPEYRTDSFGWADPAEMTNEEWAELPRPARIRVRGRVVKRALCPECGQPMSWNRALGLWDCGPEDELGHGFWDPAYVYDFDYDENDESEAS